MTNDPKIAALGKAANRVAHAAPALALVADDSPWRARFLGLWQARNRRARVQMRKMRAAVEQRWHDNER